MPPACSGMYSCFHAFVILGLDSCQSIVTLNDILCHYNEGKIACQIQSRSSLRSINLFFLSALRQLQRQCLPALPCLLFLKTLESPCHFCRAPARPLYRYVLVPCIVAPAPKLDLTEPSHDLGPAVESPGTADRGGGEEFGGGGMWGHCSTPHRQARISRPGSK